LKASARELDGQTIHVVDGLFNDGVVRMIFETLNRLAFTLSDYDSDETREVRHWKHEFAPEALAANPVLRLWHDGVVARTRELLPATVLELKRVHCNNHLYGDLQNAHTDIAPGATALYFANPTWQDDWQGETIFYDRAGEPCQAVAPKPGRLLVFDGGIVHRGGVPSRKCFEARLSVAFKFRAA
jgi:Rps23 Pro-64 3,4-dihydroxylase Tpa1-like proline 4-hydroxylase